MVRMRSSTSSGVIASRLRPANVGLSQTRMVDSTAIVVVRDEARLRYDAGMDVARAARDIALGEYAAWLDPERIVVNIDHLYREFSGAGERTAEESSKLFEQTAQLGGF